MLFKNVHVIVNPAAGANQPVLSILNDTFQKYGIHWEISITHHAGDGQRLAAAVLEKGNIDLVIAYGGDGTLREVASGMMGSPVPLAILPGGTGNAVAKSLHYPRSIQSALEQICRGQGQIAPMDVGQAESTIFLANVGIAWSLFNPQRCLKDRFGFWAYFLMVARDLPGAKVVEYALTLNGQEHLEQGFACIVANIGLVGWNTRLGSDVKINDGLLDVFVFGLRGKKHWQAQEISVRVPSSQPCAIDGDPFGKTPFSARVCPGALKVFQPCS